MSGVMQALIDSLPSYQRPTLIEPWRAVAGTDLLGLPRARQRALLTERLEKYYAPRRRAPRREAKSTVERLDALGVLTPFGVGAITHASSAAGPTDPLSFISSVTWLHYAIADLDVTISTGVSGWADQYATYDFSQGTAADQPSYSATGLGGKGLITFDGSNDYLSNSLQLDTATTPTILAVFSQHLFHSSNRLFCSSGSNNCCEVYQNTPSPQINLYNGVCTNTGAALDTVVQMLAVFGAGGYSIIGSTTSATGSPLTTGPTTGRYIAVTRGVSLWASMSCALNAHTDGVPSGTELTDWYAWLDDYYGSGVVLHP